ncbi:MAG TPA: hypothetical protein VEA81_17335 [Burkholderiaceae bacterium]|nr:hypothetical protein [Burkholderiaceae bacterium]
MAAALDPRLVYRKTAAGISEATDRSGLLTPPALRLLMLIDGRRPLSRMPAHFRPGELPGLIDGLQGAALIELAGIADEPSDDDGDARDPRLDAFKRRVEGAVEAELGPAGRVLEARLQDCVNMSVMRSVMREVVDLVRRRASDEAAARVAARAQDAARDADGHGRGARAADPPPGAAARPVGTRGDGRT